MNRKNELLDMLEEVDWEHIPSLEDRGEECSNYYYDRDGNLVKRKCGCDVHPKIKEIFKDWEK